MEKNLIHSNELHFIEYKAVADVFGMRYEEIEL